MHSLFVPLCAGVLALTASQLAASPKSVDTAGPVAVHEISPALKTEEYILPNGLSVFLTKNPKAPNVSIIHWVKAGSLHEAPGTTGIAHLFEHMMFRPLSPKEDDFSTKMRKLGGDYNANTRFESTVYTTAVPEQNLKPALKNESDRFKKLQVTKELLDTERKAVWSEYATKMDANPAFDLWYNVYRAGFPGHPFGWMIIGFREDLEKITAEDCNKFFSALYRPNNTGLFISGNIDTKATMAAVREYYGDWKKGEDSKLPPPHKHDGKYVYKEGELKASALSYLIGYRTPLLAEANYDLQRTVNHILFGSENSLAKRRLVHEKKMAAEASDWNFDYDNGMLRLYLTMLPGSDVSTVVEEVNALASDFAKLSAEEWDAYVNELRIGTAEGLQRNKVINMELALQWGKSGGPAALGAFVRGGRKVTREEAAAFIKAYINKENMVVVTNKQEKSSH